MALSGDKRGFASELVDQLSKEEQARAMAVHRTEEAELRLQQVPFGGRQALAAMHEELMELRQSLKQQEELYLRAQHELEASQCMESVGCRGRTHPRVRHQEECYQSLDARARDLWDTRAADGGRRVVPSLSP